MSWGGDALVISVSVTVLQVLVGAVQSVSAGLVVLNINIHSRLQPVQEVLAKISTYSWISSCVLAAVRLICQFLKEGAALVWGVLGSSLVVFSWAHFLGVSKAKKWVCVLITGALFLAVGLPLYLLACSWISCGLSNLTGMVLEQAMSDFGALVDSVSIGNLKSLTALKEMSTQFTDAVAGLSAAAMYYIATKAFDCFLVPLLLYLGFKCALKGIGNNMEGELTKMRELMEAQSANEYKGARLSTGALPFNGVVANSVSLSSVGSRLWTRLAAVVRRLRPEWITACSAVVLCLLIAGSTLSESSSSAQYVDVAKGTEIPTQQVVAVSGVAGLAAKNLSFPRGQFGFGVLAFIAFASFEWWCFKKARDVCNNTRENAVVASARSKLNMLNERSYWFDLPLYGGLGGTVLGFLIISIPGLKFLEDGGRIVAYMSTLMGIGATWWIQKRVISPYKTELMEQMAREDVEHE